MVECSTTYLGNRAMIPTDIVKEMDSLRDRVKEAASLEKANAGLGETILALKSELADAEAQVTDLHNGILSVASNHSKKVRRHVGP